MTIITRQWVGIVLVLTFGGGSTLAAHRLATNLASSRAAIVLAPAVPEAAAAAHARQVFYTSTKTVDLVSDSVVLASSPDGSGALCTDDETQLTILRDHQPVAVWSHRFFSADRRKIICLPPQRLRIPTGPGHYQVRIELEDRYPPTYSSRPYYLVAESVLPSLAPTHVQGVAASSTQLTDKPRESHTSARSGQLTIPPAPTPVRTTEPLPAAVAQPPRPGAVRESTSPPALPTWIVLGSGLVIVLLGVPYAVWQRRSRRRSARRSPLTGVVDLYDQETHEARTAVFDGRTPLLIQRHPLNLVPLAAATPHQVVGRIQPDALAPRLVDGTADRESTPLDHGFVCSIANGVVTIRFRTAASTPHSAIRTRGVSR